MQRLKISLLTILLLGLLASFSWASDEVDVTEPQKVAALTGVQEKIDPISAAIGDCMNSGKDHGDCMCENEELILNFNGTVGKLFETYPELNSAEMVSFKMPSGRAVSQSMPGIKNQAQMKLSCN